MPGLHSLAWDNSYARLPDLFHHRVRPTPLPSPTLVSFNRDAAALIDLDPAAADDPAFTDWLAGRLTVPGSDPVAMLYAGHQFGAWVPQLGDGRAILLGEVRNRRGEKWDLHLKGAGQTAFSRFGDGRAVLRSTIREYLGGEAMHGLGLPTTRALAMAASPAPVLRETVETAATLLRLAPTHVRFGSFEVLADRGLTAELRLLADHVITSHYPHLAAAGDPVAGLLREATVRTAELVAGWMAVGWTHGVMNTDNMSIVGLTLDYGPYGFVETFDRGFVCNHSDHEGRYAFDRQPAVGLWNCARLAEALLPLTDRDTALAALEEYAPAFERRFGELMRAKLGLATAREDDAALVAQTLELLEAGRGDYTGFFRALDRFDSAEGAGNAALQALLPAADPSAFAAWTARYAARLRDEGSDDAARGERLRRVNPRYVLRNWLAQEAIERAQAGDFSEVNRLLELVRDPFTERPGFERCAEPAPERCRGLALSCSS